MNRTLAVTSVTLGATILLALHSCTDSTGPYQGEALVFVAPAIELGAQRSATVEIRNVGTAPIGPVELSVGAVRTADGAVNPEARVTVSPTEIATLNPGASSQIALHIQIPSCTAGGRYGSTLEAWVGAAVAASVDIAFETRNPEDVEVSSLAIVSGPAQVRQGDVVAYGVDARDGGGSALRELCVQWGVVPASAGLVDTEGRFVGYEPGTVQLTALAGDRADSLELTIAPRGLAGGFTTVGHGGEASRFTSDLWMHPTAAVGYTGTWGNRSGGLGNTLYAWDVSDPNTPVLSDSLFVDARVVNDVKVRVDGGLAVITHEVSDDLQNGVTLVDLSDPLHPASISRFTSGLETGVHNAWLEGNYVYLAVDNSVPSSGLRVLDVSAPEQPQVVASFYAGSSFLHDVYVRDGLAFLSHWDAGLVILDVGNGIAGGSPTNPVEVARLQTAGGQTHNAWYWPAAGYVFVGEEDFYTPGMLHVVDLRDLRHPHEVATFRVPGATPHNLWLDEANAVLYVAWYRNGLRALDVSGTILGELERQGREIAGLQYAGSGTCPGVTVATTCAWAPQFRDGLIYVADMNSGLWVLRPEF